MEANNGNTCNDGRYYSAEYRGVLQSFYTEPNDPGEVEHFTNYYDVMSVTAGVINLQEATQNYHVYPRNKDFNPHAIALYYDEDDMIVETKVFDLNHDVRNEGMVSSERMNDTYGEYEKSVNNLTKDYVLFAHGADLIPRMEDIEYFDGNHLEAAIMHTIILIGKDEAQEKGITKIALFIVNGDVDEENIPALTFGTGYGVVMNVPGSNNNNNGGGGE